MKSSHPPAGQATIEMLLAFMGLLLILQLPVFLASFGYAQQLGFSNAQARQLLAQKSLVLGALCSDGENSSIYLSTLHPAYVNGQGHILANPHQTVSVMTLPEIGLNPNSGATQYSCEKGEVPT